MALDDGKPSPFLELCAILARESWAHNEQYNKIADGSATGIVSSTKEEISQALTEWLNSPPEEAEEDES